MTVSTFYILISIKTNDGFESFGKFNFGNNRKAATSAFKKLKGNPEVNEKTMLIMELVETINQLPINLLMLGCTLEELSENCKCITKETFRLYNLRSTH